MKRVIILILLLLSTLSFSNLKVEGANIININNELENMNFDSKYDTWKTITILTFTWQTKEEMTKLKIDAYLGNVKESPFHWERGGGKNNENVEWVYSDEREDDGYFHYYLKFTVDSGSYGKFSLVWDYSFEETNNQAYIIVQTDNRNVSEDNYNFTSSLLIGIVMTVCAGLATTILYLITQRGLTIFEEEEEDEV